MYFQKSAILPALVGLATLTSCDYDEGYDLENIDTTSRIRIDELVVPVNMEEITLNDIIKLDEGSNIKKIVVNGEEVYALTESGDFESDPIHIAKVSATAPRIADVSARLLPTDLPFLAAPKDIDLSKYAVTYAIDNVGRSFTYDINNIDDAIVDIRTVETDPVRFSLRLTIANELADYEKIGFSQLRIRMPKGLNATSNVGSYDNTTGLWTIDEFTPQGSHADIWLEARTIDFKANGCNISNHSMKLNSELFVESGYVTITPQLNGGLPTELPTSLDFSISFNISDISASSFTGTVNYRIDGFSIDPVDLSDIPDFLDGEFTRLGIANPQIYLQLNNPVAGDKLSCETGISLSALRQGYTRSFSPDNNRKIVVGTSAGVAGPYNFVLAPDREKLSVPADFGTNPEFVQFTGLREILMPDDNVNNHLGLPDKIGIDLVDPQIPVSQVNNFILGRNIAGVKGKYELIAPLALTDESVIYYSDRETDLGISTDDGNLVVEKLSVSVNVDNGTPLGFKLTAYPLDKDGNRISGVDITASSIAPNTANQEVVISMTGEISGLDGIEYVAEAHAGSAENALRPNMSLHLSNIRATVSGYYDYIDTDYNK